MNDATSAGIQVVPNPKPDLEKMLASLRTLFEPGDVIELRAIHKGGRKRIDSGYFDNEHWSTLVAHADQLNRQGAAVYVTLNPVNDQLLSRYNNRIETLASSTTGDKEIVRRRWLLIDLDPTRPANTSATDDQVSAADNKAQAIFKDLKARGWPGPVVADSGNGKHLLYAIDLPNDAESTALLKSVLAALAGLFDGDGIKVDQTVFNASRICKLYGTTTVKGDHTAAAPWRLSEVLYVPPQRRAVSIDQLREIALLALPSRLATPAQGSAQQRPSAARTGAFSLEEFLERHGLEYVLDGHDSRARFKLTTCPFNAEHVNGEAAIFRDPDGKLGFKCQHDSCADKHWKDVRESLDGQRMRAACPKLDIDALTGSSTLGKVPGGLVAGSREGDRALATTSAVDATDDAMSDDDLSSLSHAPAFDYDMCPGVLGEFINAETQHSEAPEIGVLANLVTRLSADVGRSAFIEIGHRKLNLRLNWVCAGPTALGRKGTAAEIGEAVRQAAFDGQDQSRLERMYPAKPLTALSTGEGLIQILRTTRSERDPDDFTPPGLLDNRLLVDAQEFAGVLKKASGKEATLSERLREAYDGQTLTNSSASNAMQAERPHIVVNASVPDSELVKLLSGDSAVEASNGLLNRMVITHQVRNKIVADPARGPKWVFDRMAEAYRLALTTAWGSGAYRVSAESSVELTMSEAARACYCAWYLESQARVDSAYIKALLAREANVLRVYAALLALLRGSLCTEAADLEAAKVLLKYWRDSLEFIFSQGQETAKAQQMEADALKLLARLEVGRPAPMNALKDVFNAKHRRAVIDWAQRQSPPLITLKRVTLPRGGRPAEHLTRLR